MNVPEPFIRRPVMTTLVMSAILIFGLFAYRSLPVSDLPNVDIPSLSVSAFLPGASPETMAAAVAMPLERQFSSIPGLESMSSTNAQGTTQITLQFSLERELDAAAQDVQAAISMATPLLPPDLPVPPSYRKVNPADQPVIYLALTSSTLPLPTVDEYAETYVAQRISMVNGVAQVQVYGSQKYAVRVQVDPEALAVRRIGIDEVVAAVRGGNVNLPTGTLWGNHQAFTLETNGQLLQASGYRPLIVAYRDGAPVRLEDVGKVLDSVENDKVAGWYKERRSIVLAVLRQPGTNTVAVVDAVRRLLPTFESQLPAAVTIEILYDRSVSIRESVHDVKFTLILTVTLVILVIFLFLRNVRATLIPSLAVPLSIIGTFVVMYLLDFSLDNLSLMALTLSVGFVVDDAIVVLENIVRHTEKGESVWDASLRGSTEIGFTVVSMTMSLAAVFIPVLFMGGVVGRLLHEFAVTIGAAIIVSGIVSLTLTPMLCSRFLKPQKEAARGRFHAATEGFFRGMLGVYDRSLQAVLRHRLATLLGSFGILALTGYLFAVMPKGFLPSEDRGLLFAMTEASQGVSFDAMARFQEQVTQVVGKDPAVESYSSSIGAGGPNVAVNSGRIFMHLTPRSERAESADEVMARLREELSGIPGVNVYIQNPPAIRIGGMLTKSQYQFTLQSPDTEELYRYAPLLEERLGELPQIRDVTSDLQIQSPQVRLDFERDKAATLGLSARGLEEALFSAYSSRQVSTIYAPNNQYKVIVELEPESREDPSMLSRLYVRSSRGELVPLEVVSKISRGIGPLTVNHLGQLPAVTLSFNLVEGYALSQAVDGVEKAARDVLPATIATSFQGTAQAYEASVHGLGLLLLMAILVIYLVLGILYESFLHPLTILSGLPSAGLGALLTLMLFGIDLNLYSFVGVIMLVGIVKKNAIMMIDFAIDAQRKDGKSPLDAIYEGCLIRFRPIMMTTMAALMGTLPIALGFGAGGESRQPLGLAVVGGLLVSQLITLYITPVYYYYLETFGTWVRGGTRREPSSEGTTRLATYPEESSTS